MLLLGLFAALSLVCAQSCKNIPNELKVACDTLLDNQAACLLANCCWDGAGGRNSPVPRCFQAIDTTATTTTVALSRTTTSPATTTTSNTQTTTIASQTTSATSPTATATNPTSTSSSGPSAGATVGYVLAGVLGFVLLLAGGSYVYNKMTEDDDSSPSKLNINAPGEPEPQLQRHDGWLKDSALPPVPVQAEPQYSQPYALQSSPPPNVRYPQNNGYPPGAAVYDPNVTQYDGQYEINDQYQGQYQPQEGYYYYPEGGAGQEQYYANQPHPQVIHPNSHAGGYHNRQH